MCVCSGVERHMEGPCGIMLLLLLFLHQRQLFNKNCHAIVKVVYRHFLLKAVDAEGRVYRIVHPGRRVVREELLHRAEPKRKGPLSYISNAKYG